MRNLLILSSALLLTGSVWAQQLTLFEQVEVDPSGGQPEQAMPMDVQSGTPAFTLRGTSRFGDQYSTTLINRNGQTVKVTWRAGENAAVPGFAGFNVVAVSAGSVSLVQPAGDGCIAADASGVRCSGDNVAVLGLTKTMPLATNGTVPTAGQGQNQNPFGTTGMVAGPTVIENAEGQQVFMNPFTGEAEVKGPPSPEEQAARMERQQRRNDRRNQFEAVRIDPADVPPGMRLVRTPFGDRIVPAQ
jgi:hypothetical protein